MLVLSETVLVLVIESSLERSYTRSSHDLPFKETKQVSLSDHEDEDEDEDEHEHEHEHEHEVNRSNQAIDSIMVAWVRIRPPPIRTSIAKLQ